MALRCCIRSIAKQPQIILWLLVKYRMTHPYNLVGCILVVWLFTYTYSWLNPSSLTPHSSQWPHPAPSSDQGTKRLWPLCNGSKFSGFKDLSPSCFKRSQPCWQSMAVPRSNDRTWFMVIHPIIGTLTMDYMNPYSWIDDHPSVSVYICMYIYIYIHIYIWSILIYLLTISLICVTRAVKK